MIHPLANTTFFEIPNLLSDVARFQGVLQDILTANGEELEARHVRASQPVPAWLRKGGNPGKESSVDPEENRQPPSSHGHPKGEETEAPSGSDPPEGVFLDWLFPPPLTVLERVVHENAERGERLRRATTHFLLTALSYVQSGELVEKARRSHPGSRAESLDIQV
ncbi:MAG: hypothetical protein HQL52_10270 [Magnetococcales bacterium]|nr:hypothetical protein [Magnetococcales bacterium]